MGHAEKLNVILKNLNLQDRSCRKIECYIKNSYVSGQVMPKNTRRCLLELPCLSVCICFICVMRLRLCFMLVLYGSFSFMCCTWMIIWLFILSRKVHDVTLAWKFQFLLILFRKFHDVTLFQFLLMCFPSCTAFQCLRSNNEIVQYKKYQYMRRYNEIVYFETHHY